MANPPARGLLYATTATNAAGDTVLTVACDCLTTRWFIAYGPVTP